MTKNTAQIITIALAGDPSVTKEEREGVLRIINGFGNPARLEKPLGRIVTRKELARLANRSVKWVDRFTRDNPTVLERVRTQEGSVRSLGFTHESVERFLSGKRG